jgi:mycothiol synthase
VNVRPPGADDLPDVLALLQAADEALIGESDWTELDLRDEWEETDLATNAWLVELDGELAGYALLIDRGRDRVNADGYVHPRHQGRGVGSELLRLTEARTRGLASDRGGTMTLQNATLAGNPAVAGLYERHGYELVRHFFRMVIDLGDEPPDPPRVEGVEIAPYDHPREARAVHAAVEEAFAHEWAHRPQSFEEFERRRLGGKRFDPGLCLVARDGDEVVGAALGDWKRMGDWGWVGSLGVRDGWRRRGIGEALLLTSFAEFHRRGERKVALGVDVQNPTGATRLYERVGMHVFWEAVPYEKVVRG